MTDKNYTHITIVLDKSGSMGHLRGDTIGGINSFTEGQREVDGQVTVTLNQFSSASGFGNPRGFSTSHDMVSIADFPKLANEDYVPGGGTALLDAIASAISETGQRLTSIPEARRPGKVMFVIITDGEENSSQEYSVRNEGVARIRQQIAHQEDKYNWEVVFMGANLDVAEEQGKLGMGSAYTYVHTSEGARNMWANLDVGTRNARLGGISYRKSVASAVHASDLESSYGVGTVSLDATDATNTDDTSTPIDDQATEDSENS